MNLEKLRHKFFWIQNISMFPPTQHPRLNLVEAGESNPKLDLAPGQFLDLLAGVPDTLADQLRGKLIETNPNVVPTLAGEDAKAVSEVILEGKPLRLRKGLPGTHGITHPGQNERPHLPAINVVAEAVPLVLDAS